MLPLCKSPHWLSQCNDFWTRGISERYKFVPEKELCYNCLVLSHYVVVYPNRERLLGFYHITQSSIRRNLTKSVLYLTVQRNTGAFLSTRTATGPGKWPTPSSLPTGTHPCYGRHRLHVLPTLCSSQQFGSPTLSVVAWERSWKTTWRVPNGSSFCQCSVFSKLHELCFKEGSQWQLPTVLLWGN